MFPKIKYMNVITKENFKIQESTVSIFQIFLVSDSSSVSKIVMFDMNAILI